MSVATRVYASGSDTVTEYTVHPPGFSFNPADTGTEVVTKNSASDNILTGNILQVLSLTSVGERWGLQQSYAQRVGAYRIGIAIADSLSGVGTVTIARLQRTALPTSTHYKTSVPNFTGSNYATSPGRLNYASRIGIYQQVTKPTSETWSFDQDIYFSTTAGVTTYTSSYITASAGTLWGTAGWVSIGAGSGEVIGWIINPSSSPGSLRGPPSVRASKTKGLDTFQDSTLYPPGTTFYCNSAKTSFAASNTSATPIVAGTSIYCDNSTTPRTYTLLTDPENKGLGANEIDLAFLDNGMNPYIANPVATSHIFSIYTAARARIDIMAPALFGVIQPLAACGDIALDVDFPAPIGNCRIVWASGQQPGDPRAGLNPVLTRRTTTTAPETGMTRMSRARPSPLNVEVNAAFWLRFPISGRPQPYQISYQPPGQTHAIRVCTLPDSIVFTAGAAASFSWGWSRYNRGTATWDVVTSGNAATYGGSGEWTATLTDPTGFTKIDAAGFRITLAVTSGPVSIAFYVYTGTQANRLDVWPYDCPQLNITGLPAHADCRWIGHTGWICPATAIPTVSWGTATASWSAGVLSLSNGAKPTFTATASVGGLSTDERWLAAHYQLQSSAFVIADTLTSWQGAKNGSPIKTVPYAGSPITVAEVYNPLGTGTPSTVKVNAWQIFFVDSDNGPLAFAREIQGLSVALP